MTPVSSFRRASARILATVVLFSSLGVFAQPTSPGIEVLVSDRATSAERVAADELKHYLSRLYPKATGGRIRLVANLPEPESYQITGGASETIIAGGGPRGVVHGVYGLLEQLGCRFYLSGESIPAPSNEPLSMKDWHFSNRPLVADRLVFNWHNFLSGCSTWNAGEWKQWTAQAQKMGYNGIMVHAYGNNPMSSFTFDGQDKPLGYLTTTARGRDWSTMHVNDVRRLLGGEVFDAPIFGAQAAQVPESQRVEAVCQMMQEVFADAGKRGMNIFYAQDMDTFSANPQKLITALPVEARFCVGAPKSPQWLVNPETPEGYRFYKTQVQTLMRDYPQITTLALWFRGGGTPLIDFQVAEMPESWQREFQALLQATPAAAKLWRPQNMFAMGKLLSAARRALKELGCDHVKLASGSWALGFLPSGDRFFPADVAIMPLDYDVLNGKSEIATPVQRKFWARIGEHRPLIPIIWAHHDDGNYVGRPFTPFVDFQGKLQEMRAGGFGIIHWTTRPLDLFFTSHSRQVWHKTQNEPLRASCDDMAGHWMGDPKLGAYLEKWATEAPKFGRETSDYFVDHPLENVDEVLEGCRQRLALLGDSQQEIVRYYRGLENFITTFYQTQRQLQKAEGEWKNKDFAAARASLALGKPSEVIQDFVRTSSIGGMTRGEQGLVVSLNLRWWVYFHRLAQALGTEAVRYRFGTTSHDPLAQAPGSFTYFIDSERQLWQTLGSKETKGDMFDAPKASAEIARQGLETSQSLTLQLRPIAGKMPLAAGSYQLRLLAADPVSTAVGQRVFDVRIKGVEGVTRIDWFARAGKTGALAECVLPVTLATAGELEVNLIPVTGKALLCAAVLEPQALAK